jgi:hypothetical protein
MHNPLLILIFPGEFAYLLDSAVNACDSTRLSHQILKVL